MNAGAMITDWSGAPLTLQSETAGRGEVLACGDKRVHAEAVKLLTK
jgi:fructose-1,6-bisphosphatase/inositol monophosphatase family enzyme